MTPGAYRFEVFLLDSRDRQLRRDGVPVDLNARYFDALALLVCEGGRLVSKDRFMAEVWHGVPVTDEALTQCIRTLRKALGDDAARPAFIETVPKHGYRFVAAVEAVDSDVQAIGAAVADRRGSRAPAAAGGDTFDWQPLAIIAAAGAVGGGVAGAVGGLVYGFTFDAQPGAGSGGASMLLVLLCVCALIGSIAGAGVGGGIAAARLVSGHGWRWAVVGGALGGLAIGAVVKLLGLDAFDLLLGHSPGDVAGAGEGLVLGAAVGLGGWLGSLGRARSLIGRAVVAAVGGGLAGVAIALAGGRLMGGSLDLLAHGFPGSRLRIGQVGAFFGETGFGPVSAIVTAGLEGALFAGFVVVAMIVAAREEPAAGPWRSPAATPGRS